jgi:hypothetical protein
MRLSVFVVVGLLAICSSAQARLIAQNDSLAVRADANAAKISDAAGFLEEIQGHVDLAREGEYGRLRRGDLQKLESANQRIHTLLRDRATALDLDPEQRIALYNAQEAIRAIVRNDDRGRMVCLREPTTGSRIPTTECLTVAEREARARTARNSIDRLMRNVCFASSSANPEEAHDCAK